jgi:hypothetical protein
MFDKMKEIKLSQTGKNRGKYVALVDDEDYDYLNSFRWRVFNSRGLLYAMKHAGTKKDKHMHRVIMNTPNDAFCDHIDHNGLNNQKSNLRNCTHQQNMSNRKPYGSSCYLGVYFSRGKYIVAQIQVNKELYYLGVCTTEKQAAIRYDAAALYFHGEYCNLNFK